jgi:hypothetical protein
MEENSANLPFQNCLRWTVSLFSPFEQHATYKSRSSSSFFTNTQVVELVASYGSEHRNRWYLQLSFAYAVGVVQIIFGAAVQDPGSGLSHE